MPLDPFFCRLAALSAGYALVIVEPSRPLAAAFQVAALPCVAILAWRLHLRWPLGAALLLAAMAMGMAERLVDWWPVTALCLVIGSTVVLLALCRANSPRAWIAYAVTVLLALYCQPDAFFVPLGHLLWLTLWSGAKRVLFQTATAVSFAALLMAGRLLGTSPQPDRFTVHSTQTLPGLFHEFSPAGLLFAAPVCCLAVAGLCLGRIGLPARLLLVSTLVMPLVAALAGGALFGAWFAFRQVIFLLPAIAILAAEGARVLLCEFSRPALAYLLFSRARMFRAD